MGNRDNRTLFYLGSGVAVVLLLLFWGLPGSLKKAGNGKWSPFASIENEVEGAPQVSVAYFEGQARKGAIARAKNNKISENTYQPTGNFVNSYTPKTEYQHPLVASTKFISKKDQKKKKKDKKKTVAKNKKEDSKSARRFGFDEDSDDNDSLALTRTTTQFPPQKPAVTNEKQQEEKEEENLNSVTYWEKPIFVDENAGMVSKLIESFQGRKVSNNVFYDLVTEMRQDERVVVREFGLLALTSTPSVQSFSELSAMKHTDPDAELRTAASREVANYYLEQRLSHVVGALKLNTTDSNRATYEALVVLNDATKKYAGLGTLSEETPPAQTGTSVEPRFEQALTTIDQQGLTESPDAKIKSQAQKTSTALTEFLSI